MMRACRACGCTDDDCSQCVAETGEPCFWVEYDLCSSCADKLSAAVYTAMLAYLNAWGWDASMFESEDLVLRSGDREFLIGCERGFLTITDHIGMMIFSSEGGSAWRAPHYSADELVALFSLSREATHDHYGEAQRA